MTPFLDTATVSSEEREGDREGTQLYYNKNNHKYELIFSTINNNN